LVPAYLNRALLRLDIGEAGPALDDFQQALNRLRDGRDDAVLHSGRGVALERLGRHTEADAAFAMARRRAASSPPEVRLRLLWVYGFAIAARLPEEARDAFDAVLDEDQDNFQALYGCAMLLDRQGKGQEALRYFTRALAVNREFHEARRFRAVLYARLGQFREAAEDIEICLRMESTSGATRYAGACVAALASRADPGEADRAVELLRQAFVMGYGRDMAAQDHDLDNIRNHPKFPK
jgi:tetratricopeptide (TPR) repeat protein